MPRVISTRDLLFAAVGWSCLALFVAAALSGRGRSAADYARASLEPLATSQPISYADLRHAIWSGWQAASGDGYRLSNAANPDILFRTTELAQDCDVIFSIFPLLVGDEKFQRMLVALNDVETPALVAVTTDGQLRVAHAGNLVDGVNILSLRLPDAGGVRPTDEHVLAVGLRSAAFECRRKPGHVSARSR
jgi:hypothetical protein